MTRVVLLQHFTLCPAEFIYAKEEFPFFFICSLYKNFSLVCLYRVKKRLTERKIEVNEVKQAKRRSDSFIFAPLPITTT